VSAAIAASNQQLSSGEIFASIDPLIDGVSMLD
jgi:hypothetical protein